MVGIVSRVVHVAGWSGEGGSPRGGGVASAVGDGRVDDAGGPRRLETPVSLWSTRSRAVNLLSHRTPLAAAMGDKVCDRLDSQKLLSEPESSL